MLSCFYTNKGASTVQHVPELLKVGKSRKHHWLKRSELLVVVECDGVQGVSDICEEVIWHSRDSRTVDLDHFDHFKATTWNASRWKGLDLQLQSELSEAEGQSAEASKGILTQKFLNSEEYKVGGTQYF